VLRRSLDEAAAALAERHPAMRRVADRWWTLDPLPRSTRNA
jgi:hypothetical protein